MLASAFDLQPSVARTLESIPESVHQLGVGDALDAERCVAGSHEKNKERKAMIPKEVFDIPGWYREEDMEFLARLVDHLGPHTVLEVGTYRGRSALAIASALPSGAMLYCVDLWEDIVQDAINIDGVAALEAFRSTINDLGFRDRIAISKGDSLRIADLWTAQLDLVHLDGLHDSDEVLDDIKAWSRRLKDSGVIVGHDWNNPRVSEAVELANGQGLLRGLQELAQELDAPEAADSPAPDKRCVWTAYKP